MSSEFDEIEIIDAIPEDLESIEALLQETDLTTDGISDYFQNYLVLKSGHSLFGVCGLEIYGTDGLLRSLAITPKFQKKGLGSTILEVMLDKARLLNIHTMYLLTNTAEDFYLKHGFMTIYREETPESIQISQEFAHLCPISSKVMKKEL